MTDRHASRADEIRLRHSRDGNSERMLARFYDLSIDEIRAILRQPIVAQPKEGKEGLKIADTDPFGPGWQATLEASVEELVDWVLRSHKISRDQLKGRLHIDVLEARQTLAFNLRQRWGLNIGDVADLIGVTPSTTRRFDAECQNRQMPPMQPPEPNLPEAYLAELRNVAKAFGVTPLAVFHGQADQLQRARRVFLQRMFWQHRIPICNIAKVTGFFRSRIHKQVHARRAG
ncbi:hypothetical protein [uncultured Cohaesibacter sp.]|uniref:hypothetical protein n=1 Tax=uncultured Cohaesibacter sp. TaxID=1002546 RepID=UPI0029C62B4F|nr:hypothetical protein [uncultured Cohaesibacter sp.]